MPRLARWRSAEKAMTEAGAAGAGLLRRALADWRYQMGAITALALVPRVIYLFEISRWPFFYYPVLDSSTQYGWASILIKSYGIGNHEVLAKAPAYAYFLALNQVGLGEGNPSLFSARLVQLVLGALTCGLTYLVGRRVFGNGVGIGAGLLAAAYSPAIFHDGELLDTALATFLATSLLLAVLGSMESPAWGRWFGCGVLAGLLGLTRPNLLSLAVWAAVFLAISSRQRGRAEMGRFGLALLLGIIASVAPITARNYIITRRFVAIATNGGINFHTGNNPEADGYSPVAAGIAWERSWYEIRGAGLVGPVQADGYWRARALEFWRRRPGRAIGLLVKKGYLYWNAYEIPNNLSYQWGRTHAWALRAAPLTFAVVGPLALLGIALGGWQGRGAWAVTTFIGTQMMAVIIFFVCDRYRMPALPAAWVLASYAVVRLGRMAKEPRWRLAAWSLPALAGFGVLVNSDAYGVKRRGGGNRDWLYLGQSYYNQRQYREAKRAWERATEANPRDADAYSFLGNAEVQLGEEEVAVGHMRRALEIAPDFAQAAAQMAEVYLRRGWPLEEPERLLTEAVKHQYVSVPGLSALVRVNLAQGKLGEAQVNLEKAAGALGRVDPRDTRRSAREAAFARALMEAQAAGLGPPELPPQGRQ